MNIFGDGLGTLLDGKHALDKSLAPTARWAADTDIERHRRPDGIAPARAKPARRVRISSRRTKMRRLLPASK